MRWLAQAGRALSLSCVHNDESCLSVCELFFGGWCLLDRGPVAADPGRNGVIEPSLSGRAWAREQRSGRSK